MFTTDYRAPHHRQGEPPRVSSLERHRRRRRLDHLLEVRTALSRSAAERRSHGLDDADFLYGLQLAVEEAIRDQYPDVFDERFSGWTTQEAADEHPVGVLTPGGGICEAVATDRGLNLIPPEAA
jgi:hypothetical protein